jgi:DNA mismatch endonuclease Vsr
MRAKVAVFCDGDFWHGRHWPSRRRKLMRGSNARYWVAKIASNMKRDRRHTLALSSHGWLVLRFWEGDLTAKPEGAVRIVARAIRIRLERNSRIS